MNKLNKIAILSITFTIAAVSFTGCSSSSNKNPKVSSIVSSIRKDFKINTLKKSDAAKIKKDFGIDSSKIEDYAFYIAPSFLKTDQILIIKAKDSSDVDAMKDKISKALQKKEDIFKSYLPKEADLVHKNVLDTNGKYILSVVSKDSDKIESAFNKSF